MIAVSADMVAEALRQRGLPVDSRANPQARLLHPVSLEAFAPGGLGFYSGDDPEMLRPFHGLEEGLMICGHHLAASLGPGPFLFTDRPRLAFIYAARLFLEPLAPGLHPTALVDPEARLGAGVSIGAYSIVGRTQIGEGCQIGARVCIGDGVRLGPGVRVMSGALLGDPGLGTALDAQGRHQLFPHFAGVEVGEEAVIGTASVVQGGALTPTIIGEGALVSARCLIGHNSRLGRFTFVAAGAVIGGSARVGQYCFLGLGCCLGDYVELADRVTVGMNATVNRSCRQPGLTLAGPSARQAAT